MRSSGIPAATAKASRSSRNAATSDDDVVVARVDLHRARLALHVHQAEVRAAVRDDARELRVAAQRGDVVDELRAELERAPRDLGLRGVDRDGQPGELLEHREDPRSSSSTETPSEPGRVDSPPTSTIAAPSSSIRRAAATAASGRSGRRRRRRSRA